MSDNTTIEWADTTWGPVLGCDRVSPGCDNCYAITQAHIRAANPHPRVAAAFAGLTERTENGVDWTGRINLPEDRLNQPFTWRKPRKVFVNSLADLFHDGVPEDYIVRVFAVMALTPQHTYQILTKRHGRMRSLLNRPEFWYRVGRQARHFGYHNDRAANYFLDGRNIYDTSVWQDLRFLDNVWLGVSVEDQKRADLRIPALLATPAAVRWISAEPLLGPVDLSRWLVPEMSVCQTDGQPETMRALAELGRAVARRQGWAGLDWVVVGGESGPGARPMHPTWARDLRDQCTAVGVAFLFKQFGAWAPRGRLRDGEPLPVDNARTLILNVDGNARGRAAGSVTNQLGEFSDGSHCEVMERVGKKNAGRELDGRTWDEFPTTRTAVAR